MFNQISFKKSASQPRSSSNAASKIRAIFALIVLFSSATAYAQNLVPFPSSVTATSGTFNYTTSTRIFFETRSGSPRAIENSLEPLAQVFADELELVTGIRPSVVNLTGGSPGNNDITLNFSAISGTFAVSEAEEDQAYILNISSSGASITSQYFKGVAYGTSTLLQLLQEGSGGSFSASGLLINDSPVASFRTIMLDLARQPHSTNVVEDVIRAARMYKVRYVHLHLTDDQAFTFPFAPVTNNLTNNRTYSRQELIDLVAYADARGVTLIPELDLPGHSSKLKASGYLSPNDNSDFEVASAANFGKIQAIIDDILSVFTSSPYFHIGGDESGAGSNLEPFLEAMNDHLRGNPTGGKRRMLVWEGFSGAPTAELPPTGDDRIIVVAWEHRYNAPWNLLQAGYEIVNASWKPMYVVSGWGGNVHPGITSGRKFDIADIYRWNKDSFSHWELGNPVYRDIGPNDPDTSDSYWEAGYIGRENQVIGGQMCFWEGNESGILHQLRSRIPAMAERLWNPAKGDSFEVFQARALAVEDRALTIIQPIEITPFTPETDGYNAIEDIYVEYQGASLAVTMRNRTKLAGTIRYEQRSGRGSFDGVNFSEPNLVSNSSPSYSSPTNFSDGFSIRAKLFRSNGTAVGGETWMRYNNWEPRLRVADFDIGRTAPASIPDMASLTTDDLIKSYTLPFFRGPLRHNKLIGQKIDAYLTVPQTGTFTIDLKTSSGNADLYIDLNQNGNWDSNEKLIANTPSSEALQEVTVNLTAGEQYLLRVDHMAKLPRPALIMAIAGPGVGTRKAISEYLSLAPEQTIPPGNQGPVQFVGPTPANGSNLAIGSDISVEVEVNGSVSNIILFRNGVQVRQENGAPYEWNGPGQNDALLRNLSSGSYIFLARVTLTDGNIAEKSFTISVGGSTGDNTPPSPSVGGFSSAPTSSSLTALTMTSIEGSDTSGVVEYRFVETSGNNGGTDSPWQSSRTYTDTGLNTNTTYSYTVQMRDAFGNTGQVSPPSSGTTPVAGNPSLKKTVKTLFILMDYSDAPVSGGDAGYLAHAQEIANQAKLYWLRHSYGNLEMDFTIPNEVYELPNPASTYTSLAQIESAGNAFAAASSLDVSSFDTVVYWFASGAPVSGVGGLAVVGKLWMGGNRPLVSGLVHEFGHTIALGHAGLIVGGSDGSRVVYPGSFRDGSDGLVMLGSDNQGPGALRYPIPTSEQGQARADFSTINLAMRYKIGTVGNGEVPEVTSDSTVRLFEYEIDSLPSSGAVGARFQYAGEEWFVSFNPKMAERWADHGATGFNDGVIVQWLRGEITGMLDFTPGSIGNATNLAYIDSRDGALRVGSSFTFPVGATGIAGPTIVPLSTGVAQGLRYIDVQISGLVGPPTFVDTTPSNTEAVNGTSPWYGGRTPPVWRDRTDVAGSLGVYTADEDTFGPNNDYLQLKTTITGLVPGETYNVFLDYAAKGEWGIRGGLAASTLEGFSATNRNINSLAYIGENDSSGRVTRTVRQAGDVSIYRAYLGDQVANGSGEIEVFIDDVDNAGISPTDKHRAWYDGVAYRRVSSGPTGGPINPRFVSPTPADGSTLAEGSDITVAVEADGTVANVLLLRDGVQVREETGAPFEWNASGQNDALLQNLSAGSYTFLARVTLTDGRTAEESFTITVDSGSGPQPIIFVDGIASNTEAVNGTSPWYGGRTPPIWRDRTDVAGSFGVYTADEDSFGSSNDYLQLKTTLTGLVPGETYNVFLDYAAKNEWAIKGGLTSSNLEGFAATNRSINSLAYIGENDSSGRVILTGGLAGDIPIYRAYLGDQVANGSGEIEVFIDDADNAGISPADRHRAWYDGVAYRRVSSDPTGGPINPRFVSPTPADGSTLAEGSDITVAVEADGTVANVLLLRDGVQVREETGAPFEWNTAGQNDALLQNLSAGSYTFLARVTLTDGRTAEESFTITVESSSGGPQGPQFVRTSLSGVSNQSWTSVDLGQSYNSAVIIATPIYPNSNTPPVVTRIRNVAGSGFEIKIDRADGATDAVSIDVSIIAVEEGVYTQAADGVTMEAVKYTSTITASRGSWTAEAQSYQNNYTAPVVLGQVMSANDSDWSVFWSMGTSRNNPADSSNLNVGKQVSSDTDKTRADEVIGYIVIEAGSGSINGNPYVAGVGADTVRGIGNTSSGYSYNHSGLSSASAAAVSMAGIDGGDGGWAVLYGANPFTSTQITTAIDEDQIGDTERNHTTEQVSYLITE